MRDMDKNPYSADEQRVCEYLQQITDSQVGCGDDPIGFLLASHNYLRLNQKHDDWMFDTLMKKKRVDK